ncbi:Glycerol dehydrogenase [compost metagenome]
MITVKAPTFYVHEHDVWEQGGALLSDLGKHGLIIAGQKAWEAVRPSLLPVLEKHDVHFEVRVLQGEVTVEGIDSFAELAHQLGVDLIIGAGGGKVLDLSKAVAEQVGLPIVAIPTIAATCAAWSALTVLYDAEGVAAGYRPLRRSPDLILVDYRILVAAPRRYLAAGIADTLVKWHEFSVNLSGNSTSLALRTSVAVAKLALDLLEIHAVEVYEQAGHGEVTPEFKDVVDAIIMLAGLVGTIQDGSVHAAIAHGLHDSLTQLGETHGVLHGEKVAFGLFTQWVLEGRRDLELQELARLLQRLDQPLTLAALGLRESPETAASVLAAGLRLREGASAHLAFGVDKEEATAAILQADRIGQTLLTELYTNHTHSKEAISS